MSYPFSHTIIKILDNLGNEILPLKNITSVNTIAGQLPVIFTSNGSNLTHYEIYGNTNGVGDYDSTTQKYLIPITITGPSTSQTITLSLDAALTASQKITLADTNVNIPTYNGRNVITVGTSVQPSAVLVEGDFTFISMGPEITYTITYYNYDGSEVLDTETVTTTFGIPVNASGYTGTTPTKASDTDFDYTFTGWSTTANSTTVTAGATENIQQNTNLYAVFSKSLKNDDTISDSWEEIIANCGNGTYASKYQVGDLKTIDIGTEGLVQMQIVAINTDVLADSNNTAPITWISKQLLQTSHRMNPAHSSGTEGTGTLGGWEKTEMRSYLKETVKLLIPEIVRNAIKPVKKYSRIYNVSGYGVSNVLTTEDVWIPSYQEVFGNYNSESSGVYYSAAFPDNASRVKSKAGSSTTWWWLRSTDNNGNFYCVYPDGSRSYYYTTYAGGVALGFCT